MKELRDQFKHNYTADVQKHILSHLLSDPDTFARCRRIMRAEYFSDHLSSTARFILEHADTYHTTPHIDLIHAKTGVNLVTYTADVVQRQSEWFFKEFEAFCRYRALENVVLEGIDLLRKGEASELERRVKDAMTISLMSNLGTDYYDDPEERLRRLIDNSQLVSTGWKALDHILYGGFSRGALELFLGNSGAGKSLILQNLSLNWSQAGYSGIYFSLELSEEETCLKMDSMLTGLGTRKVRTAIGDAAFVVTMKGKQAGRLTVKRLPENGTNVNDLEAYLKEYEISTGERPDFIIVDYMDLLMPNNSKIDPSNLFVKDKFVSEELRALMHRTNTFGATAGQLNRGSIDIDGDFNHSHVAGGISKINTADNVFALWAPTHLKEKGEFDLKCIKARTSSALNKRIKLGYNNESMRLTDFGEDTIDVERPTSPEELREAVRSSSPKRTTSIGDLMSQARRRDDL